MLIRLTLLHESRREHELSNLAAGKAVLMIIHSFRSILIPISDQPLADPHSRNLRKVKVLLDAFEKAQKKVQYYALDVSLPELERTFSIVHTSRYRYVSLNGLYGTYDDGLAWLGKERNHASKGGCATCVMSLGSSIGNFTPQEAARFLAEFATVLDPADYMLIGLDACQDLNRVFQAYNDSKGVTEQFYRNGLDHVNRLLGYEAFKQCDWKPETNVNKERHQAVYLALRDIKTKDHTFAAGERLALEISCKYPDKRSDGLWRKSELIHQMAYANKNGEYSQSNLGFSMANSDMMQTFIFSPLLASASAIGLSTMRRPLCHRSMTGTSCGRHGTLSPGP